MVIVNDGHITLQHLDPTDFGAVKYILVFSCAWFWVEWVQFDEF